jgi:hypothetical protein
MMLSTNSWATITNDDILDFLRVLPNEPWPQHTWCVMPSETYRWFRAIAARDFWKRHYRTARVIGDRDWAIRSIGSQRRDF